MGGGALVGRWVASGSWARSLRKNSSAWPSSELPKEQSIPPWCHPLFQADSNSSTNDTWFSTEYGVGPVDLPMAHSVNSVVLVAALLPPPLRFPPH